MYKALAKSWIEKLRSNEYVQGKEVLRDKDNAFCCLGVLCDMYVNKGVGTWERHSDRYLYKREDQQSAYTLVTLLINDTYLDRGEETELTEMNDEGCTFEEIADFLERRYIKGETVDYADYIRIARERS